MPIAREPRRRLRPQPAPRVSRAEVALVAGRHRLIGCLSVPPVKILNPGSGANLCPLVLANYGGGMVQGDCVRLEVVVGEGAHACLGTQGYSRLYKCPSGDSLQQEWTGRLGGGSLVCVLPDPLVPQAGSRFQQVQVWDLQPGAMLVWLDWVTAGRRARGERFEFAGYRSRIEIRREGRLCLADSLDIRPQRDALVSRGSHGTTGAVLALFAVGCEATEKFAAWKRIFFQLLLDARIPVEGIPKGGAPPWGLAQGPPGRLARQPSHARRAVSLYPAAGGPGTGGKRQSPGVLGYLTEPRAQTLVMRAAGPEARSLLPIARAVSRSLSGGEFFGTDVLARKL